MSDPDLDEQPAQRAGLASFHLMSTGEKEAWIDLFSEDCLFEDPVGVSPLDPTGKGHRKSDLSKFWDASIGLGKMTVECGLYFLSARTSGPKPPHDPGVRSNVPTPSGTMWKGWASHM